MAESVTFYLVIGVSISVAVLLRNERGSAIHTAVESGLALLFWPFYLPALLQAGHPSGLSSHQPTPRRDHESAMDEIDEAIAQVDSELKTALDSLDGWAEDVLSREQDRFAELRKAWTVQARRIHELDRLLAQPTFRIADEDPTRAAADACPRWRQSQQARDENIQRLQAVRARLHEELMGTLAWVRELVTMIHLAKFTGAPASRAEELVAQIAAAVEGLTEVSTACDESVAADSVPHAPAQAVRSTSRRGMGGDWPPGEA